MSNILIELARNNRLGHFYRLIPPNNSLTPKAEIELFFENFIQSYAQEIEKTELTHGQQHEDILILDQEEKKSLTVDEDFEELNKFLMHKPLRFKRKILFIPDSTKLTVSFANKCLKIFEEPHGNLLILLGQMSEHLLETIKSRSQEIKLKPSSPATNTLGIRLSELSSLSLSQFIEKFSKLPDEIDEIVTALLQREAQQKSNAAKKEKILLLIKKLNEMDLYHQPAATKLTLIYDLLNSDERR